MHLDQLMDWILKYHKLILGMKTKKIYSAVKLSLLIMKMGEMYLIIQFIIEMEKVKNF